MADFQPQLPPDMQNVDPKLVEKLMELGQRWRDNPVLFVKEAIGVTPVRWQQDLMMSLVTKDKIAVRSGHGVGKSSVCAWIVLWWLCTRAPAKVACTAPTAHQLSDVLWSEIGHWAAKMRQELKDMIDVRKEYIYVNGRAQDCFAVARTARQEQPEAFQGFHSPNMLFIVDEASAVPDIIFQVGQGAMSTKGAKTIMVGNPNRLSGFFYDAFHSAKEFWHTIHVRCHDSPLANPDWIRDMEKQYGADSDVYRVRVLGDFPKGEANGVIALDKIEASIDRELDTTGGTVIWGLDVARQGNDRTALAKRQGSRLMEPILWRNGFDNMQVAGWIVDEYTRTPPKDRPYAICVDVIGYGAGVFDRLKELRLPVKAINVANASSPQGMMKGASKFQYNRLRDELWFRVQEWFDGIVSMPDDAALISELVSIRYRYESNGKVRVTTKDELKAEGRRSPDLADAFCLTFAYRPPINRLDRKTTAKMDYDLYS